MVTEPDWPGWTSPEWTLSSSTLKLWTAAPWVGRGNGEGLRREVDVDHGHRLAADRLGRGRRGGTARIEPDRLTARHSAGRRCGRRCVDGRDDLRCGGCRSGRGP